MTTIGNTDFLTISEVAERESVTISRVYQWVYTGVGGRKLPCVLIRNVRHVSVDDLEQFNTPVPVLVPGKIQTTAQKRRMQSKAERHLARIIDDFHG